MTVTSLLSPLRVAGVRTALCDDVAIDRITALGHQLIAVHEDLREQVDALYEAFDRWADGATTPGVDLSHHCIAFCRALHRHHTGEDAGLFTVLLKEHPDLEPVIGQLVRDHDFLASILVKLDALAKGWSADADPHEVYAARQELDGLAAVLENHFAYEERKLVPILNALRPALDSPEIDQVNRALLLGDD